MPIHSVESFKKAVELNQSLSAANLAFEFLSKGFSKEASQVIDKVKQQNDLHPRVGEAIAAISEKEKAESETEKRLLNEAYEQKRFLLLFAEAYFTKKIDCPNFGGVWRSQNGIEMTLIQIDNEVEALWLLEDKKYKFTGQICNRAAKITTYKMNYSIVSNKELDFEIDGRGYAYLSSDGQHLFLMTLKEKEHSLLTLDRTN
jgi:hypothetical protein